MKLNLNSTSARLYRWVFATSRMPDSLCPYFWKLVLMWIVLIPYTILSLPYMVIQKLSDNNFFDRGSSFGEKPGSGLVIWGAIYLAGVMLFSISAFWVDFPKESFAEHMQVLGIFLWIIVLGVGGWNGAKWLIEKYKDSKIKYDENGYRIWEPVKEKSDSIVVSFVKSTYHKYCPKIEWFR
jgi:hypothetical protein